MLPIQSGALGALCVVQCIVQCVPCVLLGVPCVVLGGPCAGLGAQMVALSMSFIMFCAWYTAGGARCVLC